MLLAGLDLEGKKMCSVTHFLSASFNHWMTLERTYLTLWCRGPSINHIGMHVLDFSCHGKDVLRRPPLPPPPLSYLPSFHPMLTLPSSMSRGMVVRPDHLLFKQVTAIIRRPSLLADGITNIIVHMASISYLLKQYELTVKSSENKERYKGEH